MSDKEAIKPNKTKYIPHTIVVGSGPVGVRFVHELLERDPNSKITLFGEESVLPYNRVMLSALLAGETTVDDLQLELPITSERFRFSSSKITEVNKSLKRVIDNQGNTHNYDRLVLATGAQPFIPNIAGKELSGVYTFRSLRDAEQLYARSASATKIVVVGGGLLGIETACSLRKNNTEITLVQQGEVLMNKQLDESASQLLEKQLEKLGIKVITNMGVRSISSENAGRVSGVHLRNKEYIECSAVVFCSGITPNVELARQCNLRVTSGVMVNELLQTSEASIYAIGECCEFDGQTYGFAQPGFEQAAVLADVMSGGSSTYSGSIQSSSLKVIKTPVRSFGEVINYVRTPFHRTLSFSKGDQHRKIITHKGVIVGGLMVGEWSEANRVLEAYKSGRKISIFQAILFRLTGRLWPWDESQDIATWPASSIVCQCAGVSKGSLQNAISQGCSNLVSIQQKTRASSVCGSCKPLVQQLIEVETGHSIERPKEWAWAPLLFASLSTIGLAFTVASVPAIEVGTSVQEPALLQSIWDDKFWKQVTGFTMLGLTLVGLLMSLRKRIKFLELGKFAYWRMLHVMLGVISAAVLVMHTGLSLGDNLNQLLMINFLLVLVLGSTAGSVVAMSHRLKPASAQRTQRLMSWLHIFVTWPLPVLLATHILTVYYY